MIEPDEESKRVLVLIWVAGVAGLVVGVARGIVQQRHGGWFGFLRGAIASVVVAVLSALWLHDAGLSLTQRAALIGALAYVADDMLLGLGLLAKMFSDDPASFMRRVWGSLRGGREPRDDK